MTTETSPTGEHPATNVEVKTAVTWGSLKTVAAIIVTVFGGGWIGYATVVHAAEQTVDGGLTPVKLQVSDIDKRLERHIDEEARHHRAQAGDDPESTL